MTIAIVVAICIVLLILAFLAPRLSRYPQRGVQKTYSAGGNTAGKAPGPLGRWLRKPFDSANKWTGKSGSAGRRGRDKAPFCPRQSPADWRSSVPVVCSRILRQARVRSFSAAKCLTTLRTRVAEISMPWRSQTSRSWP